MDFARKQLEKYGWTDGKGLGKNENGISEALKPKLKRSVTGIGHDAASDFTEHWWTQLYNKAAGNVQVEDKNGKTKKIKTKDAEEFEITNSMWKIKRKKKKSDKEEQYADYFVRKAVLSNGGSQMEKTVDTSGSENEDEGETVKKDVFKMTDEELFAACEGRTAHKGARHGLKATGKLARIAQQEEMLLTQSQYEGYSHAKRRRVKENNISIEESSICSENDLRQKKKKKKKHLICEEAECVTALPVDCEKSNADDVASLNEDDDSSRKSKICKDDMDDDSDVEPKKKKKKHKSDKNGDYENEVIENYNESVVVTVKKHKKKKESL